MGIIIEESKIPVAEGVRAACELLGLDPIYVANEGKLVAVVEPGDADKILAKMKQNKYGSDAVIIGEVTKEHPGRVMMKTKLGPSRIIDMLSGELLPRIC
jgi:hydrogenase expression/formation protein HypE